MDKKYIPYEQKGVTYNLYDLPDGFEIFNPIDLSYNDLKELPDLSKCICYRGFICSGNPLKSLKGAPKEVHGYFDASGCKIETTEGISKKIGGKLNLAINNLKKLDEFPQEVGAYVLLDRNPLESLAGLSLSDIKGEIYVDDSVLEKYHLDVRRGCVSFDELQQNYFFWEEVKSLNASDDKQKLKSTAIRPELWVSAKRQEKWGKLQMLCLSNHYPRIDANVGDNLFDLVKEASRISCSEYKPVYVGFGKGCAIPENTKFYDACFMALAQTDDSVPEQIMEEISNLRQSGVDISRDMKIRVAFFMNEIIRKEPEQVKNFSAFDLADAYSILRQMKVPENKFGLPVIEKELNERFPERLKDLQQKNQGPLNQDKEYHL